MKHGIVDGPRRNALLRTSKLESVSRTLLTISALDSICDACDAADEYASGVCAVASSAIFFDTYIGAAQVYAAQMMSNTALRE